MTLRVTPEHLRREIDYARDRLTKRRERVRHIVEGMSQGLTIREDGYSQRLIENHYHSYVALVLPRLVSGEPKTRVETPRSGEARMHAVAGEAYVNQWIRDTRHRIFAQRLCTDFLVGWGLACMKLERAMSDDDDDDSVYVKPALHRLDSGDGWWDVRASSWQQKRFSGYSYLADLNDIQEAAKRDPSWNKALVAELPTDAALSDVEARGKFDGMDPMRGEVALRACWVPDYQVDNAPKWTNGAIFTMATAAPTSSTPSTTAKPARAWYVRVPRAHYGPPWGPLYLYDAYYLPGQSLGMSPLEAVVAQVDELNLHANKLSESTARHKRIGLGDAIYRDDVEIIRNTPDGDVAFIDGFDKQKFLEATFGGADAEQRMALAEMLDRLQRNSAMYDAERGNVTGVGTATENALAGEASSARIAYLAQRFADCDELALQGVLWHAVHTGALRAKVDPELLGAPPEVRDKIEVTITGGGENVRWEDYQLTLDRYSMERTSESLQQRRAMEMWGLISQVAQMAPMIASYTDLRIVLDNIGHAFNQPNLSRIIDPDIAAKIGGAQMAANLAPAEPTDASYAMPKPAPASRSGAPSGKRKPAGQSKPAGATKMAGSY